MVRPTERGHDSMNRIERHLRTNEYEIFPVVRYSKTSIQFPNHFVHISLGHVVVTSVGSGGAEAEMGRERRAASA